LLQSTISARPADICFDVLKKTVLSSSFSLSFSIFFLPYNECLSSVSSHGCEFRWGFFVLELRVPCFVFFFMVHEEPGDDSPLFSSDVFLFCFIIWDGVSLISLVPSAIAVRFWADSKGGGVILCAVK